MSEDSNSNLDEVALALKRNGDGELRAPGGSRGQQTSLRLVAGRTLNELRTENTSSGLLPAEEALLVSAGAGEQCTPSGLALQEAWPLATPDKDRFGKDVRVRAAFVRLLALGCDEECALHEQGIKLVGALVTGTLDLTRCEVKCPLTFSNCWFENSLLLREARLSGLGLSGSRVPGIDASNAVIDGSLRFDQGFRCAGGIWLYETRIEGTVSCEGGRIAQDSLGRSIVADGTFIRSNMLLRNGFRSDGQVWLRGCKIGGSLDCERSEIRVAPSNQLTPALFAGSACIRGVSLSGCRAAGGVSLRGAEIDADLICEGGSFSGRTEDGNGLAFDLTSARIKGNVNLRHGFRAEGGVSLHGSEIGGSVELGNALPISDARRARENGTTVINQVGRGVAFNANNAKIKGNLLLLPGVRTLGAWSMVGAEVGGALHCFSSRFLNRTRDGQGISLNSDNARFLTCHINDCILAGQSSVRNAMIQGDLDCNGSRFLNSTPDGVTPALAADGARIQGNFYLSNVKARGKVSLMGARISSQLSCDGSTFINAVPGRQDASRRHRGGYRTAAVALDLQDVHVGDWLFLGPPGNFPDAHLKVLGSMSLASAHARQFSDHHDSWPPEIIAGPGGTLLRTEINLDDFSYDRLDMLTPVTMRKQWLRRRAPNTFGQSYSPQPFEQLARVLRAMGRDEDARTIAQDKQAFRRQSKEAPFGWGLYGFFVGYGYRPGRLVGFLVALWLGCALIYWQAWRADLLVPAQPDVFLNADLAGTCAGKWSSADCAKKMPAYPMFNPVIYALELSLPVLDLQQKRSWAPTSEQASADEATFGLAFPRAWYLWAVVWAQTLIGWLGSLLLAAVLTGIVKKD